MGRLGLGLFAKKGLLRVLSVKYALFVWADPLNVVSILIGFMR